MSLMGNRARARWAGGALRRALPAPCTAAASPCAHLAKRRPRSDQSAVAVGSVGSVQSRRSTFASTRFSATCRFTTWCMGRVARSLAVGLARV